MEQLLELISKIGYVSPDLESDLRQSVKFESYRKKEILLERGKVCNYLYFVTKGLLKASYDVDGEDVCSFFMEKGDFVISVLSFFRRIESIESIEVLEDCEVLALHHTNLMELYDKHLEFNIIGRKLTEHYYCLSEERLTGMRKRRAIDRYKFLLDNHPELINKIPSKDLASYLGISPETLSRMRATTR